MKIFCSKFGYGAFMLFVSGVLCKCLGALFRLPLTNLLGVEGIGVFQLIMSLFSFALVITSGGLAVSLSKLISSARARQQYGKIKTYLQRALLVGMGSGLIVGLLFLILCKYICIFQGIDYNKSYLLFFVLLPLGAGIAGLKGFFQGYGNMLPTAISQIVEQIAKFAFGLLFALIFGKYGVADGVFGAFFGVVLSEIFALAVLAVWCFVKRDFPKFECDFKLAKNEFDKTNFLIVLSASVIPIANAFGSLIIVPRLMQAGFSNSFATQLFGVQSGIVGALLNFPLVISIAVTTALLPNVSYAMLSGASSKRLIEKGLQILLLSILPTTFGLVAISKQALPICYPNIGEQMMDVAFNLLIFESFSIVFTALMQFFVTILQANGNFKFVLLITVVGGLIKTNLTFFLASIPEINVFALVFGNIGLSAFVSICSLMKLKKSVDFKVSFFEIFVLLFSTVCMFFCVYTFLQCDYFGAVANIIIAVLLGVLVYFVFTIPFTIKIFSRKRKTVV